MAMNDRQRKQLLDQMSEAQHSLKYNPNLTDEQRASAQMQIDSAQRRLDIDRREDIFSPQYSNAKDTGADIFTPDTTIKGEDLKELFSGYDFGVNPPAAESPHFIYSAKKKK